MNRINIRAGTLAEAYLVYKEIPEFTEKHTVKNYKQRIGDKPFLVLIAFDQNILVGFKMGYIENDYFYSWLGGIIPLYRRKGIASNLAEKQENWVKAQGINKIRFKTLNRFKGMLIFALNKGFEIIGTEPFLKENTIKIILEKQLT